MRLPLPSGPVRVENFLKGGITMLFVGIDWSDRSLDFHLRAADGRVLTQGQVKHSVEGLAELFTALESHGLATEIGIEVDEKEFRNEYERHQKVSSASASKLFKGGLSDASNETKKLHTATHLLNEALRMVLNKKDIVQRGSNITPERLRFDFNFDRPLESEEIEAVEKLVNEQIKKALPVVREEMTVEKAKSRGAQAMFDHKYGDAISVYKVGNFSTEICGGPHVSNTSELGVFKITKQKGIASGVRRIRAVLHKNPEKR